MFEKSLKSVGKGLMAVLVLTIGFMANVPVATADIVVASSTTASPPPPPPPRPAVAAVRG